jgi:predicted ATPase/DNA-binding winged helix-turn-helix (wHTH) protein
MGGEGFEEEGYRFGEFRLQPQRRRLLRDGEPVPLSQRALGILIALIERHDRVVSKDELIAAVWRRAVVEDHNLAVHVSTLRKILGPDMIVTVPGRGYKFTAALNATLAQDAAPVARTAHPADRLAASPALSTNLPRRLTNVIGRETELRELIERVGRGRLVTLSGPSGIGKTRLAIELGWRMTPSFPGGVWRVDLAPLADPEVVVSAVASVLGVALRNTDTPVESIAAAIDKRRLLVILDNCEHLVGAVAALVEMLLERVANLSVVTTSRETLRVPGEQIYRLNPLAVPFATASKGAESDLAAFGAIALFIDRAWAADRSFVLAPGNARSVVEICRRLDGIPLALEMAAARLPLLGIEGLRARLGERLRMLGAGRHTAEWRHRTLRDTVAWSYDLLDAAEQQAFRRFGIFAGDFSLDAAVDVAAKDDNGRWDVVDLLGRLIDKSLVTVDGGDPPRYRLLETLRLYALEQLEAAGEIEAIAARHAEYFDVLFDRAYQAWETTPNTEWLRLHGPEIDNVRAALDWAQRDHRRPDIVISLTGSAVLYWQTLNLVGEGRALAERALSLVDEQSDPAAVARLHRLAGTLWRDGDRLRAVAYMERSAAGYRRLGDQGNLGIVLSATGGMLALLGRSDEAKAVLVEAEAILTPTEFRKSLFNALINRGVFALLEKDLTEALRYSARALDLARAQQDVVREIQALANLSEIEFNLGAVDRAAARCREAVARSRAAPAHPLLGWMLANLASYLIIQGEAGDARATAIEALTLLREEGGYFVRVCLQQWALFAALEQRYEAAARLLGYVDADFATAQEVRQPTEQIVHERIQTVLRAGLAGPARQAEATVGAGWTEREAIAFVFDTLIGRSDRENDHSRATAI